MGPFALFVMMAAPQAAVAPDLHLACAGGGTERGSQSASTYAVNSQGQSAIATTSVPTANGYADQLDVEITGGVGRVRLPRSILPGWHGGHEGWFDVRNLVVNDREITGDLAVNFANHPKMRIDRITGVASVDGKRGSFVGQCHAFDPATALRAF